MGLSSLLGDDWCLDVSSSVSELLFLRGYLDSAEVSFFLVVFLCWDEVLEVWEEVKEGSFGSRREF